jgi:urea transporter
VVLGIAVWIVFGLLAGLVLEGDERTADLILRYGLAVPLGVIGLAATWAPWHRRWWHVVIGVIVALSVCSGRCTGSP